MIRIQSEDSKEADINSADKPTDDIIDGLSEEQLAEFNNELETLYAGNSDSINSIDHKLDAVDESSNNVNLRDKLDKISEILNVSEKPANKVGFLSFFNIKVLYTILIILIVISISAVAASVMLIKHIGGKKAESAFGSEFIIQPENGVNSSNYLYIKQSRRIDDKDVSLVKIASDSLSTVIYFDSPLSSDNYYVSLRDDENNVLAQNNTSGNPRIEKPGTVFRFQPLNEYTKSFAVNVQNINSGESVSYGLRFEKPLSYPQTKYIDKRIGVDGDTAYICDASFSSTGSYVSFVLKTDEPEGIRLSDMPEDITLTDGLKTVLPLKNTPDIYEFGDKIIGRMDFAPLKNLDSKISIAFKNIFRKIKVRSDINIEKLFLDKPEYEITFSAGNYNIILERAGFLNSKCIVVLHAEDFTSSERTEVQLDAELVIKMHDGSETVIPGKNRSKKEGCDLSFDISEENSIIKSLSRDSFILRIRSADIRIDKCSADIDLKTSKDYISKSNSAVLDSVKSSFKMRIDALINGTEIDDITGFSSSVLYDAELMSNYSKLNNNINKYSYSALILAYDLDDTNLSAVVTEALQGENENNSLIFYRTHKITANLTEIGWIIDSDEVIRDSV